MPLQRHCSQCQRVRSGHVTTFWPTNGTVRSTCELQFSYNAKILLPKAQENAKIFFFIFNYGRPSAILYLTGSTFQLFHGLPFSGRRRILTRPSNCRMTQMPTFRSWLLGPSWSMSGYSRSPLYNRLGQGNTPWSCHIQRCQCRLQEDPVQYPSATTNNRNTFAFHEH